MGFGVEIGEYGARFGLSAPGFEIGAERKLRRRFTEDGSVEINGRATCGREIRNASAYSPSPWVPQLQRPSTQAHPPEYCCQYPGVNVAPVVGWTMVLPGLPYVLRPIPGPMAGVPNITGKGGRRRRFRQWSRRWRRYDGVG